jgi:hypothetical protein
MGNAKTRDSVMGKEVRQVGLEVRIFTWKERL